MHHKMIKYAYRVKIVLIIVFGGKKLIIGEKEFCPKNVVVYIVQPRSMLNRVGFLPVSGA